MLTIPQSPPRHFQPTLKVFEAADYKDRHRCQLHVYVNHLSDAQLERVKEIVDALPTVVESVNQQMRSEMKSTVEAALRRSLDQLTALNSETWNHERWHAAVLREVPCLSIADAEARCANTIWDADELLVLPHQGRQYVPTFQFLTDGSPSPAWATLMSVLLTQKRFDDWDLFAWLIRPHSMLNDQSPIAAIESDPKRVRSLASRITADGTL